MPRERSWTGLLEQLFEGPWNHGLTAIDHDLTTTLDTHPELCRRVIIPAELKWEVRDKLDQANIPERTLFPGLDGLSRSLARYYLPRARD